MRPTRAAVLLIAAVVSLGLTMLPALGDTECANYYIKAPFVGIRQDTRCVMFPSQFDFPYATSHCDTFPTLNSKICVGVDLHLPLP